MLNRTIAQLLTVLLLVPALMPQGMMLARDTQSGVVEITICSGFDSRIVTLDLASGVLVDPAGRLSLAEARAPSNDTAPADEQHQAKSPCPFALAGAIALPGSMQFTGLALAPRDVRPAAIRFAAQASDFPVHSPRAPPRIS